MEENPHTLVSLLHLDADLYAPTAAALEHFVPRIPKGAIILFDELNKDLFPGDTLTLLEKFNINQNSKYFISKINAYSTREYGPYISYEMAQEMLNVLESQTRDTDTIFEIIEK